VRIEHGNFERLAKKALDFLPRHREWRTGNLMLGIVEGDEKNNSVVRQDVSQRLA